MQIRRLGDDEPELVSLVASRMRATLVEVVGEERGTAMYALAWLEDRVREHLDPSRCEGAVWLAESEEGVLGHTILRLESDERGRFGLFSTIYVVPDARRGGLAARLLGRGEAWFRELGLERAETCTGGSNQPLIKLFENAGYRIVLHSKEQEMVRLRREL